MLAESVGQVRTRRSPLEWLVVFLLALHFVGLIGAVGGRAREIEISAAKTWDGSTAIDLTVSSCKGDAQVKVVSQTQQEVRLRANSARRDPHLCADIVRTCLDQPLGSRTLVDHETGKAIVISRDMQQAPSSCG